MADIHDLIAGLRSEDAALARQRLPPDATGRIRRRMQTELEQPRRSYVPMVTFVAGAMVVLAFLAWRGPVTLERDHQSVASATASAMPYSVVGERCQVHDGAVVSFHGACEIAIPSALGSHVRVTTDDGGRLQLKPGSLALQAGRARFEVGDEATPVRLTLPSGSVVAASSRFEVRVADEGGRIDLYAGSIEFDDNDGSTRRLSAGQQQPLARAMPPRATPPPSPVFAPVLPTPPATPEASAPHTAPAPRSIRAPAPPDLDDVVGEIQALRGAGDYRQAAERVREALRANLSDRSREVLSYELITILTGHLNDRERACQQLREHATEFPAGRYATQVERWIATLECERSHTATSP